MTPLKEAIKKAKAEQYPEAARFGSEAEESLAWLIEHHSNLPKPQCQVQLIPDRKFTVDFVWEKEGIVVEIDGGVWMKDEFGRSGGAHSRPKNILRDMEKSNLIQAVGYRIFRFTPEQIKNGEALEFIKELF